MFKQLKDTQFVLQDNGELVTEASQILENISGDKTKYAGVINNQLFDSILSRIVAREFMRTNNDVFSKYQYVTIVVDLGDRETACTLGMIPDNMNKNKELIINGVLVT